MKHELLELTVHAFLVFAQPGGNSIGTLFLTLSIAHLLLTTALEASSTSPTGLLVHGSRSALVESYPASSGCKAPDGDRLVIEGVTMHWRYVVGQFVIEYC